jgi:hypothetical protein
MQCERIRKLIRVGIAMKGEPSARQRCRNARKLATIFDIIRKNAVRASLKAVDASRECPA